MHRITPEHRDLFIGGRWVATSSNECIEVLLPDTGSNAMADFLLPSVLDVDDTVDIAHLTCHGEPWTSMTSRERATLAERLLATFDRHRDRWAMCTEVVIDASEPDMQDPYARVPGATRNEREAMAKPGATAGVVVIIASTDTPAVTLVTEIAMALADGSAVIVNLPADATRTGRLIGELVLEANIPAGGVSVLSASRPVSRYLATHPDVVSVVVAADMMSPHAVAA